MQFNRLLAVDPSLTSSGWALFKVCDGALSDFGVITPPGPKVELSERLVSLQGSVQALVDSHRLSETDVLVCEGPAPLVLNPQSALKVEHVRSIFETVARSRGVNVPGRLNPRTVQTELLGMRGKQLPRSEVKSWARITAMRLYGDEISALHRRAAKKRATSRVSQDVIDAVLIGALAVSKVSLTDRSGMCITSAFAHRAEERVFRGRRGASSRWGERDLRRVVKS